jgi:hypothetical protein
MADSPLFAKLKKLDPKIAQVYFNLTKDDPKAVIDAEGVSQLFGQAVDQDNTITSKELDALIAIIQEANFSQDGIDMELRVVTDSHAAEALGRGVGKLLKSDDAELKELTDALTYAASHINFISPGTHLTYNAGEYQAMKKLVEGGDINVIAVKDHGLVYGNIRPKHATARGAVAAYDGDTDPPTVFLFDDTPKDGKKGTIAHEFAHGIQDWNNDKSSRKYRETDAYIVEGLIHIADTGKPISKSHPVHDCVDIVLAGKATSGNADWTKAYEAAADGVGADPLNSAPTHGVKNGADKQKKLAKLLQAIQKSQLAASKSKPAPAKPPAVQTKP